MVAIIFIFVFVFLFVMVGLLIWLERYAKYCKRNNIKITKHVRWLACAGMNETCYIINKQWKDKW